MLKTKLIISIFIFSILLGVTSVVKNQTRIIEKNINKIKTVISYKKKDLNETQLDYFYLSSPQNLSNRVQNLGLVDYVPMDFSKIYLNYQDFENSENKISILNKTLNEKKIKKK